jgi:hypothetical protein
MDIKLNKSNCRIVRGNKLVDIYLRDIIQLSNFNNVDNFFQATSTSGVITFSTYVQEIPLLNRDIGAIVEYNITNTEETVISELSFELNFNKTGVQISGSKKIGRF